MSSYLVLTAIVCLAGACEPAEIRVWDGDTMWIGDRKIRMTGYDTPERGHRADCPAEASKAEEARERLAEILGSADEVEIGETTGRSYDRDLVEVGVDGASVGDILVDEGLATRRMGEDGEWCR